MMKDILLVEDNEELSVLLRDFLERDGYTVILAATGEDALSYLEKHMVKIMVLDVMLPGMDGFTVCRSVREKKSLPVLIISARSGRGDQLIGYELGADDYMEKPVDPEILSAKIKALIFRAYSTQNRQNFYTSGEITVYSDSRRVFLRGRAVELNAKEYELLLLFIRNPGKTLSKEYIFGQIWGMDSSSEEQTLTVHVKMLRTKIEKTPRTPERIVTVWGVGYRYEEI